jgi:hypothetical protein
MIVNNGILSMSNEKVSGLDFEIVFPSSKKDRAATRHADEIMSPRSRLSPLQLSGSLDPDSGGRTSHAEKQNSRTKIFQTDSPGNASHSPNVLSAS